MSELSISNDHNVYVVGAGFGASVGLPTMANFMLAAREAVPWLIENERHVEANAIVTLLEFRLRASAAAYRSPIDLENIEELFSLGSALDESGLTSKMQRAIASTLDYASATSSSRQTSSWTLVEQGQSQLSPDVWPIAVDLAPGYADSYVPHEATDLRLLVAALTGQFSEPSKVRQNTFITFNYDMLLEESLTAVGLSVDYGVRGLTTTPDWLNEGGIPVLKLHGSVAWLPDSDGSMECHPSYADVQNSDKSPLLVPPTWRKSAEGIFSRIWDRAIERLRSATRIVIVGYSVPQTDQYFRYLIAAGLQENISLRNVIFVDPNIEHLEARAMTLFRPELIERGTVGFVNRRAFDLLQPNLLKHIGRPMRDTLRLNQLHKRD